MDWFGPVGIAIGAVLGGLWWLAGRAWPAQVAAAVVVVADLALTGMLHFDGLLDSADGLIAPMGAERRLSVMSSPDVGAFAVGAGAGLLLLRWAALSAIRPTVLLPAGLWCLSRTGMTAAVRILPYARQGDGLAAAFAGRSTRWPIALGAAAAVALACSWRLLPGIVALVAAGAAGAAVLWLAQRRIGGYTGDVLGAFGFVAETAGLLVAAARW